MSRALNKQILFDDEKDYLKFLHIVKSTKCEIGDITLNDIIEAVENRETIKLKGYEIDIRKVD